MLKEEAEEEACKSDTDLNVDKDKVAETLMSRDRKIKGIKNVIVTLKRRNGIL